MATKLDTWYYIIYSVQFFTPCSVNSDIIQVLTEMLSEEKLCFNITCTRYGGNTRGIIFSMEVLLKTERQSNTHV